jgi:hypothetical protein
MEGLVSLLLARIAADHRSAVGDPYWDSVISLLHFDGDDGSTDFIDEVTGDAMTVVGSPAITTETYQFGGASGEGSSSSRIWRLPPSAQTLVGVTEYTIEGFFRQSTEVGNGYIWTEDGANETYFSSITVQATNGTLNFGVRPSRGGANAIIASSGSLPVGSWVHIAICRTNDGTATIYLGGVASGSGAVAVKTDAPVGMGYFGHANGYGSGAAIGLDEWRITRGVARYTGDFSPPSAPFPNHT